MIGVLGATGRVGGHVAAELAARDVAACALVRDTEAELPLASVRADLDEPATLPPAFAGVERLLLLTPHGPEQDRREAAALDAAVAAGVRRIVKISGGAATLGPNGTTATGVAHWRSEQRIERSGLEFAFLRPSFYMQNLLSTVAPTVKSGGVLAAPFGRAPVAMVDVRDVAACAVAALLGDDDALGRPWQLTGPRAVSFDALAAQLGVRFLPLPAKATARALRRRGAPPDEIEHATRMAAYFSSGADGNATRHVERLTGRPARPVEAFLAGHPDAFTPATPVARLLSRTPTKELV